MPNSTLSFTMQNRVHPNWCWTAVATSTADFYHPANPHTQCSVVNAVLSPSPGKCCCAHGTDPVCDVPYSLEKALRHTGNWRSTSRVVPTWRALDTEIASGYPVGVQIRLLGGSAHFVAVIGTGTRANDKIVYADPDGGTVSTTKLKQLASSAHGVWSETYFTT